MPRSTALADTGQSTTLTFATGITATLKIRYIDPSEESLGQIDCSDVSTTGAKKTIPEDLTEPVEYSMEYLFDTFDTPPVPGMNLGLVTHTYPLRPGETTPATRAGTAYVSAVKHPRMALNELQVGMLKIRFDNSTALTYTKST
jgi:hypothetical protein